MKKFPLAFADRSYLRKTNPLGRWNTITSAGKNSKCIQQNGIQQIGGTPNSIQNTIMYEIYGNIDNSC